MFQEEYSRYYMNFEGEQDNTIKGYIKFENYKDFSNVTVNLLGINSKNSPYICYLISAKENTFDFINLGELSISDNKGSLSYKMDSSFNCNIATVLDKDNNYIATSYKNNKVIWKLRFEEKIKTSTKKVEVKTEPKIENLVLDNEICEEIPVHNEVYNIKIQNLKTLFDESFETHPSINKNFDMKWWKVNDHNKLAEVLLKLNYKYSANFIKEYISKTVYNDYFIAVDKSDEKCYLICAISSIYGIDPKPANFDCMWYDDDNEDNTFDRHGYWVVGVEL